MPPAEPPAIRSALRDAGAGFLHLVFPTPCHVCRRPLGRGRHSALCGACWDALERLPQAGCRRCGWPFPAAAAVCGVERPLCQRCRETDDRFEAARAVLLYRDGGIARAAILLCKHGRRLGLLQHLAALLAAEAPEDLMRRTWDAAVAVPLHWRRRWRRGFNQAEALARAVGRRHGFPVERRCLVRVRATPPQSGDAAARQRNLRNAFAVRRAGRIAGKRLLLVDDVFTTGATANACAAALLAAGAAAVGVLTLARVE
jgi:ComF family protein